MKLGEWDVLGRSVRQGRTGNLSRMDVGSHFE